MNIKKKRQQASQLTMAEDTPPQEEPGRRSTKGQPGKETQSPGQSRQARGLRGRWIGTRKHFQTYLSMWSWFFSKRTELRFTLRFLRLNIKQSRSRTTEPKLSWCLCQPPPPLHSPDDHQLRPLTSSPHLSFKEHQDHHSSPVRCPRWILLPRVVVAVCLCWIPTWISSPRSHHEPLPPFSGSTPKTAFSLSEEPTSDAPPRPPTWSLLLLLLKPPPPHIIIKYFILHVRLLLFSSGFQRLGRYVFCSHDKNGHHSR
ncbi:uncharacterized protein LOC118599278 [Oryzias melastigma]|uniref:uncharacterized protein LOC118599278 n=1 Tax=Oryzias melastigma TaxID=30732 RepID=UPI00168D26C5|nr:uncharacterized protein LOC118599278 [Oryzias melastigma]